jgi:ribosomal protein S8
MKITDPIADLLTRIRNAARARKSPVMVPHSNMKEAICKVLKDHKFIEDVRVTTEESGHKTLILEISKVVFPFRKDTSALTVVVIIFVLISSILFE